MNWKVNINLGFQVDESLIQQVTESIAMGKAFGLASKKDDLVVFDPVKLKSYNYHDGSFHVGMAYKNMEQMQNDIKFIVISFNRFVPEKKLMGLLPEREPQKQIEQCL
jgi:hypothetical protein